MSVELVRTQPDLLAYVIKRDDKAISKGAINGTTIQFAITAGGPWGVELHCSMSREKP